MQPVTDPKTKKVTYVGPATLIVQVPADAKLTIDDQPTTSTSELRVFETPPLSQTNEYTYTLKAQVTRDGQIRTETRQVNVRGGEQTVVRLDIPQGAPGISAAR